MSTPAESATRPAELRDLGAADYRETWALQHRLVAERQADRGTDTLILVEHPEVITLGRRPEARRQVRADDLPVIEIERGGGATYHGPGQLVGYPILRLAEDERDLHRFLRALEGALIATCDEFGLHAGRRPGWTGVWIGERKVASIGIAVRRWVTLHGFALNVSTRLERFRGLSPCGLDPGVMTSMSELCGRPLALDEVKPAIVLHLGRALRRRFS